MNALTAGFASADITPPPGREIPGLFERRIAAGVNDDLYVRAAVLDDGAKTIALVQVDAIAVPESVVAMARAGARRACGIPAKNCLIAATHTHSGGPLFAGFMSEPDPRYMHFVADQISAAIGNAYRLRRPALAGWNRAPASGVAYNRRFKLRDGSRRTHPGKMNPEIVEPVGPEDPTVTAIAFSDPATFAPFGCIVNFACHATHMNGVLYSADYVKWVVDTLQAAYGAAFGVVFLNGACGDVTQVDNRNPRPLEIGPYWAERTGRTVGAAALQAVARTDYGVNVSLDCASVGIRANIRVIPPGSLQTAGRLLQRKKVTAKDVETIYANELVQVEKMRKQKPYRLLEIMGLRLGDGFLWGVPAELFQTFALDVAASSPFRYTCCAELANGYNGYVCAETAFAGGGYENRTARSSLLEEKAGRKITRAAKSLAKKLYDRGQEAMAALRLTWPEYKDDSVLDGINQLGRKRRRK